MQRLQPNMAGALMQVKALQAHPVVAPQVPGQHVDFRNGLQLRQIAGHAP